METKVRLFSVLVCLCLMIGLVASSNAQTKGKQDNAGKKVEATRGASQYSIPGDDKPEAKPAGSRGSQCCIDFSNNTGYYVDVWVDNTYRGRVAPWNTGMVCVGAGYTAWYAQTAGGTYYWQNKGSCDVAFVQNLNL